MSAPLPLPQRPGAAPAPRARRLVLLAPAFLSLASAALAGLVRLGWTGAPAPASAVALHGGLMVGGFFGTLIALERAVALGEGWAYLAPALSGLGAAALLLGVAWPLATLLLVAGAVVFLLANVRVVLRQRALFTFTLLLGTLCLLLGEVLWREGWSIASLVPWWLAFLVLTIAGERLELSRLVRISARSRTLFGLLALLLLAGCALSLAYADAGARLFGAALILLAGWLARHDVARRTIRQRGLPRYVAVCLFAGYAWLLLAGVLLLAGGALAGGPRYDATLHAVFLGFAFSMVFGHAPVIFPAVVRLPLRHRPADWGTFALLHGSLLVRVASDAGGWFELRRWAGLGNALALLLFVLGIALSALPRKRA